MSNGLQLTQTHSLQQRLAPQQVQFLKLLQLPLLALEQSIKAELEQNPMLEDVEDIEQTIEPETQLLQDQPETPVTEPTEGEPTETTETPEVIDRSGDDNFDYAEFSTYASDDTSGYKTYESHPEFEDNPAPSVVTLTESVNEQLPLLNLSPLELVIAEEIVGNIDPDGYLRRPLEEIVSDLNASITSALQSREPDEGDIEETLLAQAAMLGNGESHDSIGAPMFDTVVAEAVLRKIQFLDPVGIGSRNLQECLTVQLHALPHRSHTQELALRVLSETFEEFLRKHYEVMLRKLNTSEEALRAALEDIQKLNPKPGNTTYGSADQTVIPDFNVERADEELVITLNDNSIPQIRISRQYQSMLEQGRSSRLPREARTFLRQKYDAAKSFVTALQQRRITMYKTMRAIAELQHEFFFEGEQALKPLFYRHVADRIGVDVSTVCRVVNGKYVQCDWGVFELRYFFSDSITTDDGDEISNRVMKTRIKDIIQQEDKNKPLSDDDIARMLNAEGFNIARRTVAKYRESQQIPVARLRRNFGTGG